ncbi:hypothetical protein DT87_17960 [Streptomyces sp. NTK 937]|nr:hypothetical protein DT87_17960 [Streptomyces sp. NTK 937]
MYASVSGESRMEQHAPAAQQRDWSRRASMLRAQHWQVVRSCLSQVRTSLAVSLASIFLPRPGAR